MGDQSLVQLAGEHRDGPVLDLRDSLVGLINGEDQQELYVYHPLPRETLENPDHPRENRGINQGQDLGDGRQAARLC